VEKQQRDSVAIAEMLLEVGFALEPPPASPSAGADKEEQEDRGYAEYEPPPLPPSRSVESLCPPSGWLLLVPSFLCAKVAAATGVCMHVRQHMLVSAGGFLAEPECTRQRHMRTIRHTMLPCPALGHPQSLETD